MIIGLIALAFEAKGQLSPAVKLSDLADTDIRESSGLAASIRYPGIFWTHNDSGNLPALYAFDQKGTKTLRLSITNATNVDWEDMAEGPGPALWIGDIGDNSRTRNDLALYKVLEPVFDPLSSGQVASATAERFPFSYPDGHHDAETLLIRQVTGEVFVVTKEANGSSGVFRFPLPLTPGFPAVLTRVATVNFTSAFSFGRTATGGDISPDGSKVVIRTYLLAYEWPIAPGQSLAAALSVPATSFPLLFSQGESIAYSSAGNDVYFTSEGVPCPLGMRARLRGHH
jgi:hypothetical protein